MTFLLALLLTALLLLNPQAAIVGLLGLAIACQKEKIRDVEIKAPKILIGEKERGKHATQKLGEPQKRQTAKLEGQRKP